jgi:hypothetical protein
LLSINKQFVRFFIKSSYEKEIEGTPKQKPFCDVLDQLFSQMFRNTDLAVDRKVVDITSLKQKFRSLFNPEKPHDAYKFLVHMINGVARETIDSKIVSNYQGHKKKN